MKKLLLFFLATCNQAGSAQTKQSFDLASFTIPKGWKKETSNAAVSYTHTAGQQYAKFIVYKSISGTGVLSTDFDAEWNELVTEPYKVSAPPELQEDTLPNDWKIKTGTSAFTFNGSQSVVILLTAVSKTTKMSMVFLTNSDKYMTSLEKIINSLAFKKVPAASSTIAYNTHNPVNTTNVDLKLIGKWNRSGAVHPSYTDASTWTGAGYTISRYEFKQDGTYQFTERSFRMANQYIFIVKENGTYRVNGHQLTVIPQKSVIQSYTKKNGADELGTLVKTQDRPLEKVTYTYLFHYFAGIQEWNLVLQADKPTLRDGDFSSNTTFRNAWYFDQKFTNNDLTSPKGN